MLKWLKPSPPTPPQPPDSDRTTDKTQDKHYYPPTQSNFSQIQPIWLAVQCVRVKVHQSSRIHQPLPTIYVMRNNSKL